MKIYEFPSLIYSYIVGEYRAFLELQDYCFLEGNGKILVQKQWLSRERKVLSGLDGYLSVNESLKKFELLRGVANNVDSPISLNENFLSKVDAELYLFESQKDDTTFKVWSKSRDEILNISNSFNVYLFETLVIASEGRSALYCMDLQGNKIWNLETEALEFSAKKIDSQRVLVNITNLQYSNYVLLLDLLTGEVLLKLENNWYERLSKVNGEYLYIHNRDELIKIDLSTYEIVNRLAISYDSGVSPIFFENEIVACNVDADSKIYVFNLKDFSLTKEIEWSLDSAVQNIYVSSKGELTIGLKYTAPDLMAGKQRILFSSMEELLSIDKIEADVIPAKFELCEIADRDYVGYEISLDETLSFDDQFRYAIIGLEHTAHIKGKSAWGAYPGKSTDDSFNGKLALNISNLSLTDEQVTMFEYLCESAAVRIGRTGSVASTNGKAIEVLLVNVPQ